MQSKWMVVAATAVVCAGLAHGQNTTGAADQSAAQPAGQAAQTESLDAAKARMAKARISPMERAQLANAEAARANDQDGPAFLAANQKKPGVKTLGSGVQYRVLQNGKGKKPSAATAQVRCRYVGRLLDGSTFDKVEEKDGTVLMLKGLVPGLRDAVQQMPVGAKWEVVVPPAQGYGKHRMHNVGPNAVLIYEIELLGVV